MILRYTNASPWPVKRATPGSAGLDLCANIGVERTVYPGERWKFDTGVSVAIPIGFEGQVRGRSGLALNHGILMPTGTIDSDYRGVIGVILFNLGTEKFIVRPGDRIAQLVVSIAFNGDCQLVDELDETERGVGGFGSSGVAALVSP